MLADCEDNIKYNTEALTAEARLFGTYLLNKQAQSQQGAWRQDSTVYLEGWETLPHPG